MELAYFHAFSGVEAVVLWASVWWKSWMMFGRSSQFTVVVSEGVVVDNFVDYEIRVERSLILLVYVSWAVINWGSDAVGIYEYVLLLYL